MAATAMAATAMAAATPVRLRRIVWIFHGGRLLSVGRRCGRFGRWFVGRNWSIEQEQKRSQGNRREQGREGPALKRTLHDAPPHTKDQPHTYNAIGKLNSYSWQKSSHGGVFSQATPVS